MWVSCPQCKTLHSTTKNVESIEVITHHDAWGIGLMNAAEASIPLASCDGCGATLRLDLE